MSQIQSTRFGTIHYANHDLFTFPQGLIGFEGSTRWILLRDSASPTVGWLQSASADDLAFAVVSPRRFVPEYRFRIAREQLDCIHLSEIDKAFVLSIVSKHGRELTANLKAPLIVNLDRRLGCQVAVSDDHSLQHKLTRIRRTLRKIA